MQPDFSQIGPLLVAALVVFSVYRRLRRSFGQQLLLPSRMIVRIVLLLVIGAVLVPMALRGSAYAGALCAGVLAGVALAVWGAARTRFVRLEDRLYYVPHTYTGIAVSMLFVGRLVYRLVQVYGAMHATPAAGAAAAPSAAAGLVSSPLTLGLFFVVMGYYVCYYSVVLRKSKHIAAATPPATEVR
jgi:hypothetical protein